MSADVFTTLSQSAGVTLGPGGGVIDVREPGETLVLQDVGVQSTDPLNAGYNKRKTVVHDITGPGDLTKSGPGALRLYANAGALDASDAPAPIANSFAGRTRVTGGTLQINGDGALGPAPAAVVHDQLFIEGAALQTYGPTNLAASRGVTVGPGGAAFDTPHALAINGAIAGSGTLTKTGGSSLALNARTPRCWARSASLRARPILMPTGPPARAASAFRRRVPSPSARNPRPASR